MCGIAALYKLQKNKNWTSHGLQNELDAMLARISHRGPDGEGSYVSENNVAIGMCRLSIVDIENGDQPIWNEDRTIAVVCNGEIYNHQELRSEMESKGHVFATHSDVEVIVHLYESFGEKCLEYMEGIFAFALLDETKHKLFVARDRLGVKPLYYCITNGCIRFASEIRALLIHKDIKGELSQKAFYAFNALRYVPAPNTIVMGIRKIAPGQYMIVRDSQIVKRSYWQCPTKYSLTELPKDNHVTLLKQHIYRAVKSQVPPDVQSGILLSGGLDSTILLSTYTKVTGNALDSYTVFFEKPKEKADAKEYSEIEYAKDVARHFGSKHIFESYSAEEVLECLPSIVASIDEPIADPTAIPLWFATRLAKKSNVKVLFSGEGLDEIFNGYSVYNQIHWIRTLQHLPPALRTHAITALEKMHLPGTGILYRSLMPIWQWYQGVGGVFSANELKGVLNPSFTHNENSLYIHAHIKELVYPARNESILTQMTHFDVKSWLPENTLVKSDKVSMSHSIELRVPFLDYKLVEFALQCEDREKLRGSVGKRLVRQAAQEIVPSNILNRPKAGFPVPITAWIFGEWKDYVHEVLLSANSTIREMYKQDKIEDLFKSQNRSRTGRMLWTLLTFELWSQNVYQNTNSRAEIVTRNSPLSFTGSD